MTTIVVAAIAAAAGFYAGILLICALRMWEGDRDKAPAPPPHEAPDRPL